MMQPARTKFRKQQKGRHKGKAYRGGDLAFGDYGLKVLESGRLTARQIEAGRIAMTRFIKRGGKVWIRVFPDKPITKKPAETRMGHGKGNVEEWAAVVKELSVEELTRKAGELRENLFNLKIRRRAGTLEATSDVTKNKRDLARILTLLTQKTGSSKAQRKAAQKQPQPRQPAEQRDRT